MDKGGPKIVTIGGGTGSFMVLNGLKSYTSSLTAIVNMVDDGGSTGKLRDEFGTLPSGDVRQCLVALAESSDTVRNLFMHRFEGKGELSGHSFGNLLLSALEQLTGSFSEAVETAGEVLNISGKVVPVTLSNINLTYRKRNGEVVVGEHIISDSNLLEHDEKPDIGFDQRALLNPHARTALLSADIIVIAPGTLYGSLAPTLLVEGMKEAIESSKATVVYIANLTSEAETQGYTVAKIYKELERFLSEPFIDYVLVNTREPASSAIRAYKKKKQGLLKLGNLRNINTTVIRSDLLRTEAEDEMLIRHDPDKVARAIMKIYFS